MNLRSLILNKFLPLVVLFMTLSILSLNSTIQKVYYPAFEAFTISALNGQITDAYFKSKPKGAATDFDYNTIGVLFQSKQVLTAITEEAKRRNLQAQYDYQGFLITIDETFIAPLLFFTCLLIFTPGSWKNKGIAFLFGALLILGFAYLIVYFKGLYMVSKSGVRDMAYDVNSINFFKVLHFFFSSVTIVTVVLLTWILVAFRKSDLAKLFETN
ncbi:MAG: hypothetical protein AB8G86_18665 [Saprospiraceae bacterium]